MSHWLILPQDFFHKLPPSTHCSYHLKNLHHPAIYILLTARYYNFPKHKRVWDILLQLQFSCQLFHGPLSITGWVKWITLYIFVVTWPIWSRLPRNKGWLNFPTSSNHSALPHSLLWYVNHCNFENESGIYLRDLYVTAKTFGVCPFVLLAAKTTSFYSVSEWIICSLESVEIMLPL